MGDQPANMESIKERLDQIVTLVSDDELPLEEALNYYEEAVKLGMAASDLVESSMERPSADPSEAQDGDLDGR